MVDLRCGTCGRCTRRRSHGLEPQTGTKDETRAAGGAHKPHPYLRDEQARVRISTQQSKIKTSSSKSDNQRSLRKRSGNNVPAADFMRCTPPTSATILHSTNLEGLPTRQYDQDVISALFAQRGCLRNKADSSMAMMPKLRTQQERRRGESRSRKQEEMQEIATPSRMQN